MADLPDAGVATPLLLKTLCYRTWDNTSFSCTCCAIAILLPLMGQEGPPLSLIVLADPSFLRIQELLSGLDFAFPAAGKLGWPH